MLQCQNVQLRVNIENVSLYITLYMLINIERKLVSKLGFEPQISSFAHYHLTTKIQIGLLTQNQIFLSSRLSEYNARFPNSNESNSTSGYLVGFTFIYSLD